MKQTVVNCNAAEGINYQSKAHVNGRVFHLDLKVATVGARLLSSGSLICARNIVAKSSFSMFGSDSRFYQVIAS